MQKNNVPFAMRFWFGGVFPMLIKLEKDHL
jgi:hypothetical protein